ncbi:MAG: hypothetical protein AAF660_02305 [Pseudomonadota bacterium]
MSTMIDYIVYTHAALAAIATVVIIKLDYSERPQAVAQCLVAWIVPFLGPIGMLIFQSVVHKNMTTKISADVASPNVDAYGMDSLGGDLHSGDGD